MDTKHLETYKCEQCNNTFESYPSQRTGKHIFCSRPCQHKYRVNNRVNTFKGDKVGYYAIHEWVKRRMDRPDHCPKCKEPERFAKDGRTMIDLANISGKYKRDINDWMWLCRGC